MSSGTYVLPSIPTISEAKQKAELVRNRKLERDDVEIQEALNTLADGVRTAIEETLPNKDGGYTIIVRKSDLKKHFERVMTLFHNDMNIKGWTAIYEEKVQYFPLKKTELIITFGPSPVSSSTSKPPSTSTRRSKEKTSSRSSVNSDLERSNGRTSTSSKKKRSKQRTSPTSPLSEVTGYTS